MSNFVLVDAPNFVLVAAPEAVGEPSGAPDYVNPLFGELLHLLGLRVAPGTLASPLHFDDASGPRMRRILARYGFELPPLTLAELLGLLEYCDRLDALTGRGILAEHQQAHWQQLALALGPSTRSPCRQALALYACGDLAGLRSLHQAQGTLARLGRQFRLVGG